jgi:hypothetical protein
MRKELDVVREKRNKFRALSHRCSLSHGSIRIILGQLRFLVVATYWIFDANG